MSVPFRDPDYRNRLLTTALDYAARGWHVFPLRPGTKRPAVPNHPAHLCDHTDPRCTHGHTGWEQRATTDPDRITRAWTRRPWGIGIACGPSELLVIDLDTPTEGGASGAHTWANLTNGHPKVATWAVATPSGGHHRYYARPKGVLLGNTVAQLGPRIDTRANGGYVVAPPTQLADNSAYKLTCGTRAAPAPDWLIEALTTTASQRPASAPSAPAHGLELHGSERLRRYVETALDDSAAQLRAITAAGARNRTLFIIARSLGQLVGAGVLEEHIAQRVLQANSAHFIPIGDCTQHELTTTINSGLTSGKRKPRQLPPNLTEPSPPKRTAAVGGAR